MNWARGGGGTGYDGLSCGVTVLNSSKTYVSGGFEHTANFGSTTHTSDLFGGLFLNEYSPDGDLVWSKRIARSDAINGQQMIVADGLEMFLIGTTGSMRYDDDTVSGFTGYVIKVDSAGNTLWHRNYGDGISYPYFDSAIPDGHGGLFVVGNSYGAYVFDTIPLISNARQAMIAHLDGTGHVLWVTTSTELVSNRACIATGISQSPSGNLLVSGTYNDSLGFGNQLVVDPGNAAVFKTQMWVGSFDTTGSSQWLKVQSVASNTSITYRDDVRDIVADDNGDFYICGVLSDSCNLFGTPVFASAEEPFMAKCDPNGDLLWVKLMHGVAATVAPYELGFFTSIHLNAANEPIASGVIHDSLVFGNQHTPWLQGYELFTAYCDAAGNLLDISTFPAAGDQYSYASILDADDNIVLTGYFDAQSISLVPGSTLTSNGNFDVLVFKACKASIVHADGRTDLAAETKVFPNPNNGEFHVALKALPCRAVFEVTDVLGRIVFHENLAAGVTSFDVVASQLGTGVYVWKLLGDNGSQAQGRVSVTSR